jgi:hypothetical protein
MKYLKKYKTFNEDGTATATTAGMGAVSNAQPGALAGTTGTSGSGDVTFTFKKEKRKKGGPSQVTDLRDLKDVKTDKVEDIKESKLNYEDANIVEECLQELYDMGFETNEYNFDSEDEEYDIDDDNYGNFKSQELKISIYKQIEKVWRGNLNLRYDFDKNEVYRKDISTLRPGGKELEIQESEIVEVVEDACHKLINHLEYTSGELMVGFLVAGSAMPYDKLRHININVHIILRRNFYPVDEAYNNEQEFINDIIDKFKGYNIRPLVLNQILDFYNDQIIDDYNNGKQPTEFVDMIIKDMELGSGGYMSQVVGSKAWNNRVIKYH